VKCEPVVFPFHGIPSSRKFVMFWLGVHPVRKMCWELGALQHQKHAICAIALLLENPNGKEDSVTNFFITNEQMAAVALLFFSHTHPLKFSDKEKKSLPLNVITVHFCEDCMKTRLVQVAFHDAL
jgi:hypothetical protein